MNGNDSVILDGKCCKNFPIDGLFLFFCDWEYRHDSFLVLGGMMSGGAVCVAMIVISLQYIAIIYVGELLENGYVRIQILQYLFDIVSISMIEMLKLNGVFVDASISQMSISVSII